MAQVHHDKLIPIQAGELDLSKPGGVYHFEIVEPEPYIRYMDFESLYHVLAGTTVTCRAKVEREVGGVMRQVRCDNRFNLALHPKCPTCETSYPNRIERLLVGYSLGVSGSFHHALESLTGTRHPERIPLVVKHGKLGKAFMRYISENFAIPVPDIAMADLSDLINRYTVRGSSFVFDVVDDYDFDGDDEFGNDRSCWWPGHEQSNSPHQWRGLGGHAIRLYDDRPDEDGWHYGMGRLWLVPEERGWVGFNPYGLSELAQWGEWLARATACEWKHVKINDPVMYVNNSSGIYLTKEPVGTTSVRWEDTTNTCTCYNCGEVNHRDDMVYYDGDMWCSPCAGEYLISCDQCGDWHRVDDTLSVDDNYYCSERCRDRAGWVQCDHCGEYTRDIVEVNGNNYCDMECAAHVEDVCDYCHENWEDLEEVIDTRRDARPITLHICPTCATDEGRVVCDTCGVVEHTPETDNQTQCNLCYHEQEVQHAEAR